MNLRECDPPMNPVDARTSKILDNVAHETPAYQSGSNDLSEFVVAKPDTSNPGGTGKN